MQLDVCSVGNIVPAYIQYNAGLDREACVFQKTHPSALESFSFDLMISSAVTEYLISSKEEDQLFSLYKYASDMAEQSIDLKPEYAEVASDMFWDLI